MPVPVYLGERQVGKATTTTWSPLLKKLIALASVDTAHSQPGTKLQMEITIEAHRLEGDGDGGETAVLQSGAEDDDAGVELFNAEARRRSFGIFYFPSTDKVSAKLFPREPVVFPTNKSTRPSYQHS